MTAADDAARSLAQRLHELRRSRWPQHSITQEQLSAVLSIRKRASPQLVSSWESSSKPTPPPDYRLRTIATFFCTERSIERGRHRLIDEADLTETEKQARDVLYNELAGLRLTALADDGRPVETKRTVVGHGPWHFPGDRRVIILCGELPDNLKTSPLATPAHPDGSQVSHLADSDALVLLYGQIRAVNPDLDVSYRSSRRLDRKDFSAHLVLLGGVDWNAVTRRAMQLVGVPVVQRSLDDPERGYFEILEDSETPRRYRAVVEESNQSGEARPEVVEDVGHLVRTPNPFDTAATVTFCNGMYGVGTFGAVMTLVDDDFRDRNAAYIAEQFGSAEAFSVLFRVQVPGGVVTTPDWKAPNTVLHTWSKERER